jgi:hypothetical protein
VRDLGIHVRAGIHTGECEVIDGKAGGLAVSIGARVAANAAPSEVLVSQTVRDLVAGSGLTFEDGGEHELKGVPDRLAPLSGIGREELSGSYGDELVLPHWETVYAPRVSPAFLSSFEFIWELRFVPRSVRLEALVTPDRSCAKY